MHFEILVEDQSGKKFLDIVFPNLLGEKHTFKVHAYKGLGKIPKNLANDSDPSKRILLANLPKLLKGYGNSFSNYPADYRALVIVVCDLDDKCLKSFRAELFAVLESCKPKPETYFCIAIEEIEAWLLGDISAVKKAYSKAKDSVLHSYINDSICGTWERLAEAVFQGGSQTLSKNGWHAVGAEKSAWAEKIAPYMNINKNKSGSFCYFRDKIRSLMKSSESLK